MKVIIFREGNASLFLHINKIEAIHSFEYEPYEKTIITTSKFKIEIMDYTKTNFSKQLYKFIESKQKVAIIETRDKKWDHNKPKSVTFIIKDWVSVAMGNQD